MNEDNFNMSVRKFLKTVGVASQREIEQAVRAAVADGRLTGNENLTIEARITIVGVELDETISGEIALD